MESTNLTKAALGVAAGLMMAALPAKADIITIGLGIGNSDISSYPGPYGTVEVDRTSSTTATITFTALTGTSGGETYQYLIGGANSVGVNVNATSWTLGTITGTQLPGFNAAKYSDGGPGNEDGFGSFNQTINSFDGYTHSSTSISFTLTDKSGTWANASDVLTKNAHGYLGAAHIFVTSYPANVNGSALATGYAATPEPSTFVAGALLLLPFGASTLRVLRNRKV